MVRETRHLWVGNLPDNIREDRIKEHFKRYGRVQNVKLLAKGAGGPEGGGIPGTPGGSGLCAAVAFMDIKSAAKAHGAEHTLDERPLTTVYYEPAAIPSSASAGSSPAGSGYSASSGSVNSASRYPNHGGGGGGGSEERCSRTGSGVSSGGSGGGAGGGAGGAGPGAYSSPAADRARPRDRLYRNGPTSYTNNNNNNNNSIIDRSSHRRWYGYASPSEGGGYTGAGSRRGRARSGSSSAASNSSSRSGSSSSAPRSPSSSSEGASSPEHRNKKHQWTSGGSIRPLAICVKNLPQRSSDSSLKDGLFHEYKKHGKVSCVKVVGVNQDRYAVVYFKKPSDVEKALEVSQDKLFFGCKISVAPYQGMDVEDNESRPYETDLDEFHPKATRTLFIGNLEKDVTPAMLREKFKHFGKIIEIDIKKQTGGAAGYAFCQYANISSVVDAIRSMDGEYVGNSRVKLGFGKSMATNCVWIDGVTENTEKQVISLCENIGSVLNVNVCKGTGHALVVFDQVAAAQQAVKDLRGLSVRGRKLQVDFASRECQDAFYEQLEKCSNSGITATERFTDVSGRTFDATNNRYNRYETQRRAPTTTNAYSARSARSSRYQNSSEQFEDFSDRRYRYEEFSGGSGSEAGTGGGYEGSVGPALQSVVVVSGSTSSSHAPHSNMRHLQKERVHLLEQLEECPSSGDELVSPKKKFKSDRVTLGGRPSGDTSRHHREISPCGRKRRGSETSKHHWRSPTPLSRSGTPLRDERPDSPPPTEPRRAIPVHRTKPMCLPLPRFAAQVLARVPPTSPMPMPDGPSAPASPLGSLATPRVPSPASSPGSSPSPTEPSLDERIRSLDERYEKWSGSRTASISECPEKSRFRPRLLDLDINEVQPSEVMRSVLAKRSVFDEDTKRLEGICDKFEPIRPICAFSSPSSARLSPSPLNSPQSAGRSPYAGSPVISTIKMPVIAAPSAPAKGLQYPFPSHPPSGLDGAPPIPPAPSEPTESDNKKLNDTSNIPRQTNASFSERVSGSVSGSAEAPAPVLNVFTSPNSTCAKPDYRTCKNSDLKSPLYKEPLSDSENVLKCDEKTISSYNSDSLDRRKIDYSDVRHTKTINTDVLADEIRDQSFKSNMCEKLTVDKVISDVKHQDGSMNLNKRSVVDSVKSESKNKFVCNNISDINIRRRPSKDESKDFDHKKEDNERRKRDDSRENRTFDKNIDMSITSNKMEKEENSHKEREDAEKEKERLENERLEKERLESERRERERLEQERREKQKLERERQEKERLEKERIEKLEKERLERERIERERLEKERLDKEKMERERERIQKEKLEMERIHKEKQEREKLERERREREFLEKERIEKARREKERLQKLENERREKLEKERLLKQEERLEKERQEKIEKERQEKIEKERREKEISDKEKLDTHDSKLEKSERKKEKIDKDSRRDKDYTSTNDSTHSSKEKRKDKEESIDSTKHRHKESYKKEQFDNRKDFKADISKTKEHSRKSSRDESVKELSRKDSSDSTASRHSHDSLKSKEYDVDLKDDSRYSSKSKHNSDNHKIRLHDKEVLPKSSNNLDTEVLLKSVSNEKSREIISPEVEKLPREKPTLDHDKHRHYSLDSQNEIKSSESKRKERLNSSCSLPANIGLKRRVSSQESVESTVDDTKKPKLSSESKKLIERRDSKDSSKHIDKNKHNMKFSKTTLMKHSDIKEERHNIKEDDRMRYKESREKDLKDRDTKDNPSVDVERKLDVISEIKLESPDIHAKNNSSFDILKSKDRRTSKEVDEIKSETLTSEDAESDHKAFFSRLELRSSEEDEKQRAQKEKMKEIKRIQQIKQIERLMQHQESKKLKNEERKKDMKDMKEKRLSNDRKSRDEKIDSKKPRKITNTSDTSDSDEPKKHSIFDIVDDGPTYISMYDKVKARSCKNMQKQEEEKRQEKIKAKFNQFKQCRAKREEKKRSTSWDEDSDSDREHKKSTSKSLIASSSEDEFRRRHKENITTDSENDHEKSKSIRRKLLQCVEDDSTDDNRKKPIARKKSHSRIVSDTSDDESFKKSLDIIKAFPDSSKIKSVKTLKKEKNVEIKMEPEDNIYESKHSVKIQEKLLNNYMDDKKLLESKHKVLTDIKNEPVFNVNIGETYSNLPQFDLKPKYNDLKSISYDDIKPTQLEDIKSIKYEDIKPTHCDISSEGEGIISDSMKLNSYLENRKKHKKKQKRQKSYPSDDEAKSDYHEKMQIINSICNSKNKEHIEKRKHSTKKEKKRDKVDNFDLFDKEKSLKKSKKLQDIAESKSDIVNSSKREEKMQDIFGPFSDESDACNKDYPLIIDSQRSKNMDMFSPKTSDIESNHESHVSDVINKEKCKEEIRRKKEKKRKERKSIHKDDDNSLDIDAAGKAIEANLFDELFTNLRRSVETADHMPSNVSLMESDVFRFTDGDDSVESHMHPHHNMTEHSKKEGKEKKKKKKKNKENRQNRKDHHHYHHHHHDKVDLTIEKDTKSSDIFNSNSDLLVSPPMEVIDISQKTECKPPLPSPSLPILIDSPPPTKDVPPSSPSPTISNELNSSPTSKQVSKPGEIRRLSEKFIPGFGGEIDDTISESAVKSISDFENSVIERKDNILDSSHNSSIDISHKNEDKMEEKPRAIISQEETEDAVAALLGESFGSRNDGFSDCYSENTQSPAHAPIISAEVNDNIPEEEAEEMRQAVQSLNASELETKPDTPQSENDLQIDTDTDEGEENSQSKSPEQGVISKAAVSVDEPKLSSQGDKGLKPQQLSLDSTNATKRIELKQAPTSTTVISKGWAHKSSEPSLLISTPIQSRDDKTVHISSILHLTTLPPQQLGQCRPSLSGTSKIPGSIQVVGSIPRPPGSFSTQPPTIKIPADHVVYPRPAGIVISPRMSGDIRLHSPKSHGELPQKITNMAILTTGSPNLQSPPVLHSPSAIQQRPSGQITVVRMQQPPLSPIQAGHLPVSSQSRTMLSPTSANAILIQNPSSSVQLNRLPITPVLAPISKPIQSTSVTLQQPKTAIASCTSAIVQPPKLITSEGRKTDIRNSHDIVIGSKLLITPPVLGSAQNATIMAQNRLMSASGNFPPQLPVLVGPGVINKSINSDRININGPINIHAKISQPTSLGSCAVTSTTSVITSSLSTVVTCASTTKAQGQEDLNHSIKSYPPSTNTSQNITTTADSKESKKVDNQTGEISNTLNLESSKVSQANPNLQSVASSVSSNEKSEPTHTSIIVATKSEVNKNNQNDTITHNKSDTLKETTESHDKKDTKPPSTVEKSKCETDFEELLKQSACETKIENPHHTTVNKTTINESKVVTNPSFSQHEVASVINDPTSNSKDSNDSKEDSDYWSAKEVNIESVIKKVDALCSASELSDDSEHAKLEWSENKDIKSDNSPKIKVDSNMKIEPNVKQEETLEGETHSEFLSSIEKVPPRIAAKRGGRGRGRKISESVIERVQTRQGAKPNRGTTASPRRGRGRIKVDKKSRSSSPGVHLPGDVYDFHEDSGDEMSDVAQNKNESRPRLILTIKSPLSSTVPNLQNAVTTNAQKEMHKTIQNVKDEKMEEFISPATNTRKSRRLQEKDVTRNTVDDVIEDVVKNTVPSKSVCGKESGPVRRSTRQNISTKPFNSDKNTDVRKSPRANKKQKDRRNSMTYESDEKSTKKDPLEITEPDTVLSVTEPVIKPDLAAPATPQVPVSHITNVITKPPKKMINEINAKLSSQIVKSPESLQPSSAKSIISSNVDIKPQDVAEEHSNVIEGKPLTITNEQPHSRGKLEEKVKPEGLEEDMLDPVTGEMIRMTRGVDGMLIPVSNPIPLGINKLDSNIQMSEDLKPSKSMTSNIPEAESGENLNAPSGVKSTANVQLSKPQMSSPTYSIVTTTPSILSKSSSLDVVGMAPSAPVVMTSVVTPSPILCTVTTTSNSSFPNITQGNIVTKSISGNIIVPSSHIVSTINPMPMTTAAAKSSSVVTKPVMIKEMYGQYSEGIQQQHLIVKTSGGAIAGMKIGPGPLSPHAQPGLPPKEISQLHQMKPMPLQSQIIHPHKQPLVRPGCGVAGPGPLGPSLPRGAQGQHASPPLHKQHTAPQPIIAGASSTRVGLTAVPSISPQGQIPLGEGMYPHFAHQHYPHYYRTHQDPRATPSPYVARSPLGAEGSEAPSPPLELRRPPGARVPHPAQSPSLSDRSTDSPQVSLYSSSSGSRYGEIDSGGRYYEAPSPSPVQGPPPPAHTPHRPSLHHRMLMEKAATTGGMGIDGGSAGDERGPSRGSAPAQGGTGLGRIQPGPPHASHAPREADSLMMLLRRYPVMWQGLLALKNDAAAVQMHFVHGNPAVASNTLPSNGDGSTPLLRIAQRMRLEPVQLEAVARKMQLENEHCMLLALPCGRDHLDVLQQSTHLTGGFITYLRRKLAAGIVNVAPPGHHQPLYTVHIFPSCEFANENLERIAPDLLHRVTDIAHLLIVIATV